MKQMVHDSGPELSIGDTGEEQELLGPSETVAEHRWCCPGSNQSAFFSPSNISIFISPLLFSRLKRCALSADCSDLQRHPH